MRVIALLTVMSGISMLLPYAEAAHMLNVGLVPASGFSMGQTANRRETQNTGEDTQAGVTGHHDVAEAGNPVQKLIPQKIRLEHGIVFVLLRRGEFSMGSMDDEQDRAVDEGPVSRVKISRPFWIGKYEVTQREWTAIMGTNPSESPLGEDHPVENVSWEDCQRFIERLNKISGHIFRLPTEAEWEYACRAGGETVYCSGDRLPDLDRSGWYEGNSVGAHHPVGQKEPNVWGLYDMHGNVYEWCQDYYRNSYSGGAGDGSAWEQPDENGNRVRRGGSYQQPPKNCRSAFRGTGKPESRRGDVGLRLIMEE